jgi:hypothetical protein
MHRGGAAAVENARGGRGELAVLVALGGTGLDGGIWIGRFKGKYCGDGE